MRLFRFGEASYADAFLLCNPGPGIPGSSPVTFVVSRQPSSGVARSHSQSTISENRIPVPFRLRGLPSWAAVSVVASWLEVNGQQRSRSSSVPRLSAQDFEVMLPALLPGTAGVLPRRSRARSLQSDSRSAQCGARGPCPLCPLRQLRGASSAGPSPHSPAWSLQPPRPSGDARPYGARGGRRGGDR